MPELRLLSLLPSATEIIHFLELGNYQVGRSHECDFPAAIEVLPICTRPAFPVNGSSAEIDREVKTRVAAALSLYEVDSRLISALRPTHILTQTQCEVCAVSLTDVERAVRAESGINARILALAPSTLADVWRDIRRVAEAFQRADSAERLVGRLEGRVAELRQTAAQPASRPRVAALEWLEPLMGAGNWVPELIEIAGGVSVFGHAGEQSAQLSTWTSWSDLVSADPDVIVGMPCGFDLRRTRAEMRCLQQRPEWTSARAVQENRVFVCDGNQFMNRPGPRLVESGEIFAQILHPELFRPTLEHIGWERL